MLIEVGSKFGVNFRLYIKHEGVNPTGTHKDRIAKLHIAKARFLNFKKVVAASCGNFGASLAYFAKLFGLEVTIFIPESFESPRVKEIEHLGASLKRIRATYEECVLESSEYAKKEVYYDANPTEKNMDLEYRGYGTIFAEIIRAVPDLTALAVPVSNGVTLSGLYMQTILDQKLVRLVGGSCLSNPIVTSVKEGREYQKLNKLLQEETEINEPLINWHSFDGESAVRAIIQSGGFAESSTDEELLNLSNTLNSFLPVSTHPSGVAGLNAVLKNQGKFSYRDIVVALVTSKNYSS